MLKICKKLQEKRFVFIKILAIIIPENGAKVSKIKCLRLNQHTLFILPLQNTPQRWQNCHRNTGFLFDYKHAYRLVFEYIETFYNTVRIHSHCGYLSPDEYEKQYRNKLLELEQKLAG